MNVGKFIESIGTAFKTIGTGMLNVFALIAIVSMIIMLILGWAIGLSLLCGGWPWSGAAVCAIWGVMFFYAMGNLGK